VDRVENFEGPTTFADGEAGTIVSLDTLEHVYDVFAFVRELDRILAPGGMMLLTSVMYYPVHAHPSDYWRFTPEAFRRLVAPYGDCCVLAQGPEEFPHTVAAVVRKGGALDPEAKRRFQEAVEAADGGDEGCGWVHPREAALLGEMRALRAYHARWGRDPGTPAFDPDLSRRVFAAGGLEGAAWAGQPTGVTPGDLVALHEIIAEHRPALIVASGVRAGMTRFLEDMLRLFGNGRLLTAGPETRKEAAGAAGPVMVVLAPEGGTRAALEEMAAWTPLVSSGAHAVVLNTVRRYLAGLPGGKPEWEGDGPFQAVQQFLMAHPEFAADRGRERHMATFAPLGFLRRRQPLDTAGWRANKATLETDKTDTGEAVLRCVTYEGKDGVWGGMLLGCERTNLCDGKTLPCTAATAMELRFFLRGAANHDRARLALNVIDDTGARLAETVLGLSDAWTEVVFPFATRADARFLGVQLVKAREETPVVFEIRGAELFPAPRTA
jgi:cephalosporin hydroxylase